MDNDSGLFLTGQHTTSHKSTDSPASIPAPGQSSRTIYRVRLLAQIEKPLVSALSPKVLQEMYQHVTMLDHDGSWSIADTPSIPTGQRFVEICALTVPELGLNELCIKVEYDPTFEGGDYCGIGSFVYIPWKYIEAIEQQLLPGSDSIGAAFEYVTGIAQHHIITVYSYQDTEEDTFCTFDGNRWQPLSIHQREKEQQFHAQPS
jgi:hypothetical protein